MVVGKARNFGLDALRCYAVLAVLFTHAFAFFGSAEDFKYWYGFGTVGVDVFFALSGFLIGRILLSPSFLDGGWSDVTEFWRRRWMRTLPAYFVVLFAASWISGDFHWSYLLFVQNFFVEELHILPVSWSLSIEEYFYLTFPLAMLLAGRRRLLFVMALYAILPFALRPVAYSLGVTDWAWGVRSNIPLRMDAIVYGVGVAWIERHRASLFLRLQQSRLLLVSAFALQIMMFLWISHVSAEQRIDVFGSAFLFTGSAISSAILVLIVERFKATPAGLLGRGIVAIALLSYSVYLVHINVFVYCMGLLPGDGSLLAATFRFLAGLLMTLAVSVLLYFGVERPFLVLRDSMALSRHFASRRG